MIARSAAEIARVTGGSVVAGSAALEARGASIDSRTLDPGDVFFAIRGEHHDGHTFIDAAAARGATLAVVSADGGWPAGLAVVRVGDTTRALQDLASDERRRRALRVVAVTGSAGKTTTRALTAAALGARFPTAVSHGNLNNHWGLPLSILRLDPQAQAAVLELGMSGPGEIALLTRIAQPDVGIITNIGLAHLGAFGNQRGIAEAKTELLFEMPAHGVGVVHASSPHLLELAQRSGRKLLTFDVDAPADLSGRNLGGDLLRGATFTVDGLAVSLALWGRHAVLNALAALGAARALDVPLDAAAARLTSVTPLAGRGRLVQLGGGVLVVDETYNASPGAVRAVLTGLGASAWPGRRVAILGDMLELGAQAARLHREIGQLAAEQRIGLLHAVGTFAEDIATGARAAGLGDVRVHRSAADAAPSVAPTLNDGDLVLIKGSRGVHLEAVLAAVTAARGQVVRA